MRNFSFAPSTSQIVCAPCWYTSLPGGRLRVHFLTGLTTRPCRATLACLPSVDRERVEQGLTMCNSHDVLSAMNLKHRSHTQRTPPVFSRLTALAKSSIVHPYPITSSPSASISGYGKKYLRAEGETRSHLSPGNLLQGRGKTRNGN